MKEGVNIGGEELPINTENIEQKDDIPEFDFEHGLEESISRIINLLKEKPRVVVAFSATSTNVGKTYLAKALIQSLYDKGIKSTTYNGVEEVPNRPWETDNAVFIFQQAQWGSISDEAVPQMRSRYDSEISKAMNSVGVEVDGVDLWVGLYRPDRPFVIKMESRDSSSPIADILIRNELAQDK